jgi:uncharacterized membrane protein
MKNTEQQAAEVREQFAEADSISRLEGYAPDAFEEAQKERIATGEIDTEEFIRVMVEHVVGPAPAAP